MIILTGLFIIIPFGIFGVGKWMWTCSLKNAFITTAVSWLSYAVYEFLMYKRVLCSGECNIRVDLLLIYPTLLIITVLAVIRKLKQPS